MLRKMLEEILEKLVKKLYPERDIFVCSDGLKVYLYKMDQIYKGFYMLDGTYSYDEVVKLKELTTYSASYGYCDKLGPIAFIGIREYYAQRSGYFCYKVHDYGTPYDVSDVYFKAYTEDEAKKIQNYTVYGLSIEGLDEVARAAQISHLICTYDSRFKAKCARHPKIFDMDCKIKGKFSYKKAKILATGTIKKKDSYSYLKSEDPITFATLGENKNVGIIGLWPSQIQFVRGFRDVWEYGADEPEIQDIRILTEKEASKIKCFELYIYEYSNSGIGKDKYQIEKFDRTLDRRFKFQLSDGTDYRLVEHTELFK